MLPFSYTRANQADACLANAKANIDYVYYTIYLLLIDILYRQ